MVKVRKSGGVHLLEVIVATSLFLIVSLFLLTLIPSAQWASRKAENQLLAENILDSEIEKLRGEPYSQLIEGARPSTTITSNGTTFTVSTEVTHPTTVDPKFVKNVNVVVTWEDRNVEKSLRGSSYIGKLRI